MHTVCLQCAVGALLRGEAVPTFDESPEAHVVRMHPDLDEARREHNELVGRLAELQANPGAYRATVGETRAAIESEDVRRFAAQIVNEPARLCATCQHPARNHTLGRCRKKRCGCGGWRG